MPSKDFSKLVLVLFLFILSCNEEKENLDKVSTIDPSFISDTLLDKLNERQQYYQHFIFEIPALFQQDIDSLAAWIIEYEPGALQFDNWVEDSVYILKKRLDTIDIIQPFYCANYFDFLALPDYPYWDANSENRNLLRTRVFENGDYSIIDFGKKIEWSDSAKSWLEKWKSQSSINFVNAQFSDENIKKEIETFQREIRTNSDIIQIKLAQFDTINLESYRKSAGYKGLFLLEVDEKAINHQINNGVDFVRINLAHKLQNSVPYKQWIDNNGNKNSFRESTKRIIQLKNAKHHPDKPVSLDEQIEYTRLNLLSKTTALISNKDKFIPIEPKFSIYSESTIKIEKKIRMENNIKVYTKNFTEDKINQLLKTNEKKVFIVSDSTKPEVLNLLNNPELEDILVCFSNSEMYEKLNRANNLVYFVNDYSLFVQQLTGQLDLTGDFVSKDTIYLGEDIKQMKLGRTSPEYCGISSDTLKNIQYAVQSAINGRAFPGCQILVAKEGCIIYDKSFGHHTYDRIHPVTAESIYDLASLTKIVSTTLVGMKLYEQEAYRLTDSLSNYLPDSLKDHLDYPSTIRNISFQELFIHKSGLPAGFPIIDYIQYTSDEITRFDKYFCDLPDDTIFKTQVAENFYLDIAYQDSMWLRLNQIWLDQSKPYKYSDVNMNTLYFIFKSILHKNPKKFNYQLSEEELKLRNLFKDYLYDEFYKKLEMTRTGYNLNNQFSKNEIVPTENERYWRKQLLHGYVHDPNAALHGGVAGNAGIFSTTNDLAILAEMWLNKGTYRGKQFLREETVNQFIQTQPSSHRGLGFNKPSMNTGAFGCADSASLKTFGHTGFTGTCIWIDPENELTYIFLSNRVHPTVNNRIYNYGIRRRTHQYFYSGNLLQ